MQNELDILRDVSRRFTEAKIPYMLTGSTAMNYYAQPRMTRDIDVVIALLPKHVDVVLDAFTPDYYVSREAVVASLNARSMFNLIHHETVIKVDCIITKPAEYRQVEFSRRQEIEVTDFKTWIVSKEDLIISKLDWAKDSESELQFRDVRNLLSTKCDMDYLEKWTRTLGLNNLLKRCLNE